MQDATQTLGQIAVCGDASKLTRWIANARKAGRKDVEGAAFRRLVAILAQARPGTVEYDFWQMVHAFEHVLSEERGKATRLSRTRQKVARVGEVATLRDWAMSSKSTKGFAMLIERGLPDLTGEAIVLRHAEQFGADVVAAARKRLAEAGIDMSAMPGAEKSP